MRLGALVSLQCRFRHVADIIDAPERCQEPRPCPIFDASGRDLLPSGRVRDAYVREFRSDRTTDCPVASTLMLKVATSHQIDFAATSTSSPSPARGDFSSQHLPSWTVLSCPSRRTPSVCEIRLPRPWWLAAFKMHAPFRPKSLIYKDPNDLWPWTVTIVRIGMRSNAQIFGYHSLRIMGFRPDGCAQCAPTTCRGR